MPVQADFDYSGKPPTDDFMRTFLQKWGYSNVAPIKGSVVMWTITTTQSASVVESALTKGINQGAKYTNGALTSVDVH